MDIAGVQTYFKDHHSGSVAALGLISHLQKASPPIEDDRLLQKLQHQIGEEQKLLKELLDAVGSHRNSAHDFGAWVAEKAGWCKLWSSKGKSPHLFWAQAFEALSVAIRGKSALWSLLIEAKAKFATETELDFPALFAQSESQAKEVEQARIRAGVKLLT